MVLVEFDVHTTAQVADELEEIADYDDVHADAATAVLERIDEMTVKSRRRRSNRHASTPGKRADWP